MYYDIQITVFAKFLISVLISIISRVKIECYSYNRSITIYMEIYKEILCFSVYMRLRTAFVRLRNCLHGNQVVHAGIRNAHLSVHSTCAAIAFNDDKQNATRVNDSVSNNERKHIKPAKVEAKQMKFYNHTDIRSFQAFIVHVTSKTYTYIHYINIKNKRIYIFFIWINCKKLFSVTLNIRVLRLWEKKVEKTNKFSFNVIIHLHNSYYKVEKCRKFIIIGNCYRTSKVTLRRAE